MVLRVQVKFAHSLLRCEWGTTSVYFGITYVCFIPNRLPVFAVEPQYRHRDFLFLLKLSFEGHIQNLQKISCWFKIWMGFVGPILTKLGTSSIWGFLWLPVWWPFRQTCWWPLSDHCSVQITSPHLSGFVVWRPESLMELSALWIYGRSTIMNWFNMMMVALQMMCIHDETLT